DPMRLLEQDVGRRPDRRHDRDHGAAEVPVPRDLRDRAREGLLGGEHRGAELEDDGRGHDASRKRSPAASERTKSSALSRLPPAPPRTVLLPTTVNFQSRTAHGARPPIQVTIPSSRSAWRLGCGACSSSTYSTGLAGADGSAAISGPPRNPRHAS